MEALGEAIDRLLDLKLFGAWWYTLGRAVLLAVLLFSFWRARRVPLLLVGFGISGTLLALRVAGDVATNGANTPYTVYLLGSNLATVLLYLGVAWVANLLTRLRKKVRQGVIAVAQRDEARAWVQQYQARLGEPLTMFPEEDQ